MSLDLVFASKGAAGVLSELAKMKQGAKLANEELKKDNQALLSLSRDVQRSYTQTLTPIEKLRQQAARLQEALKNTKLPDLDRQKAAQALERVNGKIKEIEGSTGKANNKLNEAFGQGKTALLGAFATGLGAITASAALLIRTVVAELRSAQQQTDKIAATQLSLAASRNVVIRNLPGADDATIRQVLSENEKLAESTGVSEAAINQARASALSASGGNIGASYEATRIAAQFLADRPSEIGDFAGSLLDLSKVTGSTDARVNLGLLSTVGGLSRITGQREQAQSIAPALIGAREFGFSTSESAALFSALTTASGDITGRQSGTATIQLAKQLEAFTGSEGQLAGKTTGEKLRALQSDRALAEEFLSDASFETKAFGPIRSLLVNAASDAAKQYRANLSALPGEEGLRAKGQRSLDSFRVNTLEARAEVNRAIDASLEKSQAAADQRFLTTEEIESLRQNLLTNKPGLWSVQASARISAAKGADRRLSVEEAADLLDREAGKAEFQIGRSEQTEELRRLAEVLRDGNTAILEELKRNTTATEQSGGIPANGT